MDTTIIKEAVRALIQVPEDDLGEQERICLDILEELTASTSGRSSNSSSSRRTNSGESSFLIRTNMANYQTTVRTIFGHDISSSTMNALATQLSQLMAHRIDPTLVLPATQDVAANQEALETSAITLTRHAFLAATLYTKLIAMPGSFGIGLIDVGALSNLNALLRRWCVECTASSTKTTAAAESPRDTGTSKRKTKQADARLKRSRRNHHDDDDDDDDEDYASKFVDEVQDDDNDADNPSGQITSPAFLRQRGLDLANSMAQVASQKEFLHWSEDAMEVTLDAIVCAQMTTAALQGNGTNELSDSLIVCVKNLAYMATTSTTTDDEEETNRTTASPVIKCRSVMVFVLRGVFSVLSMKVQVPNGQKGKELAHAATSKTLEGIVQAVSQEFTLTEKQYTTATQKTPVAAAKSPKRQQQQSLQNVATPPRTGRKDRRKRVSFGTVRGRSIERLRAPKTRTPATASKRRQQNQQVSGNPLLLAIVGMLQKLMTLKELDRSDPRRQTLAALTKCLPHLFVPERTRFLRFLIQMCHSKVSVHRLAGCELIGKVLSTSWFWEHHSQSAAASDTGLPSSGKSPMASLVTDENMPRAFLACIHGRLSDRAPAVRARAAQCIADLLPNDSPPESSSSLDETLSLFVHDMIVQLRQRAMTDDRATVRKAAIVALSKLSARPTDDADVLEQLHYTTDLFRQLCGNESSVAARKVAAEALTQLVKQQQEQHGVVMSDKCTALEYAWTSSVLPLVLDSEPTCVNHAVEMFFQVVVSPLIEADELDDGAWRILTCIADCTNQVGASRSEYEALKAAVAQLTELNEDETCIALFNRIRVVALSSRVGEHDQDGNSHLDAVWCFLEAITDQPKELAVFSRWIKRKSVGHTFLTEPLTRMLESPSQAETNIRSCLTVLSKLAGHLPLDEAQQLVVTLKDLLGQFLLGPQVMGAAVTVIMECLRRSVAKDELRSECAQLVDDLFDKCQEELSTVIEAMGNGNGAASYERLPRTVYLCGELAMVGFRSDEDNASKKTNDVDDPIIGLTPKPSKQLLSMIQVLLPKMLPGDASVETPEPARAHAFVTLGKLCLRDERFAKECLNIFARELHQNLADPCIAVQSNALLVLGDLCIKYTNLVDRHLPVMAACLQAGASLGGSDNSFLVHSSKNNGTALVRKHAILMLSGLLLQDYIKWRGLLFHRFLVASADSDDGVAQLAEMTLCGPLLTRYPKLFFNNFVESLFVLNKCTAHPIYMAAATAGDSGSGIAVGFDGIDLSGVTGQARRRVMFRMMLSKMTDEEKIGVAARLAKDILGAAVQSEGDLGRVCRAHSGKTNNAQEEAAFDVLSDAFFILTSPELRVGRASSATDAEDSVDDANRTEQVAAAKGRLLSKISRKHLVEIILPILCNLKTILQTSCSPLLKELMRYLAEMFRAYKTEVKEFLANDPTLLQEVEYDAKRFRKSLSTIESPGPASPTSVA